jgi:polysaccharide export outer membrane protein
MVSMIKRLHNALLATLALVSLSACMVTPGIQISSTDVGVESRTGLVDTFIRSGDVAVDFTQQVNTRLISPVLLAEMRSTKPEAQANPELQAQMEQYSYVIGVGDVLNIIVWDHPELTIPAGQFRTAGESGSVVHPDGTIFYPYIGKVSVVGKHVSDAREIITRDLANYIESPQVEVSVAAYRSQRVFVTGAVVQPIVLPITNVPLTLLDALNASSGLAADADWRSVVLTSDDDSQSTETALDLYALYQYGDMSQNRLLRHNDIIHVPRNDGLKVFVMGDVLRPQTQRIDRSGLTLAEALNNVGGVNESSADSSGIFVLRASQQPDQVVDVFQLDASVGSMLILSTQFLLKPMDVVYVTSAPIARWNKVISQLIPTLSGLYDIDRIRAP